MISLSEVLHLPGIFRASSARPAPTNWLAQPMHMKWKLFFIDAFFWLVVMGMKIPFDYFVLCQPVVDPVSPRGGGAKLHPR